MTGRWPRLRPNPNLTLSLDWQVAKAEADRNRKLICALADDVVSWQRPSAAELLDFVAIADARLAVVLSEEAAVLAQFPSFPKARAGMLHPTQV